MDLKLLALTFLLLSLAVTPVIAQPVFRVHTDKTVNLTKTYTTYYFGSGIYIKTYWTPSVRITKFFEDDLAGLDWFNYTIPIASPQDIYNSAITANCLYVNDVNYSEGDIHGNVYWTNNLGLVHVLVTSGCSMPANVSISYPIPVAPGEETVSIEVSAFNNTDATEISAGSVMVTDLDGNSTTFTLPTMFSLIKGRTYTLTAIGDEFWSFDHWTTPYVILGILIPDYYLSNETSINITPTEDTSYGVYFNPIEPYNLLPVPIIFIFGMVGLACMFVGPIYGINKIKQHEYRQGFIWAVILTALGFALFIAWLFGGNF